jgi:hypothetical protein
MIEVFRRLIRPNYYCDNTYTMGHGRFTPRPLEFIFHRSFSYSTVRNLTADNFSLNERDWIGTMLYAEEYKECDEL